MISVHFQVKPFSITVIQVYAPTTNVKEAEVKQFYDDLKDLLEITPKKKKKKDGLCIVGKWNAKVQSQEIPGVKGKFGLGVQNEVGQRLTEFCKQNTKPKQTPFSNSPREDCIHGHHRWSISRSD